MKRKALIVEEFRTDVKKWAARIRVRPRQVRLQRMRRKWASCSTRGTLSFNTEVLSQPSEFREHIIVHELLHLKVPNHGKLFKSLLAAYLPKSSKTSKPPSPNSPRSRLI